jgi:predicted O-methyltransferase YrrM
MIELIDRIYSTGVVFDSDGQSLKLDACIDPREGSFLFDILAKDPGLAKTLEVGCAYGLSSLHICLATKGRPNAMHTIIDPFQFTQWRGIGVRHLEEAGLRSWELIQRRSEFALPDLAESIPGSYDFIFIDGWHTFDHSLVDCFYAGRLLRSGGVLVIDDVNFPAVRMMVNHLLTYPCYKLLGSVDRPKLLSRRQKLLRSVVSRVSPSKREQFLSPYLCSLAHSTEQQSLMVALKKTEEDRRDWDWHSNFG